MACKLMTENTTPDMQLFPNTTDGRSITVACPKGGGVSIYGSAPAPARGNAGARLGGVKKGDREFENAIQYMYAKSTPGAETITNQPIIHTQMHTVVVKCASESRKANWLSIIYTGLRSLSAVFRGRPREHGIASLLYHLPTIIPHGYVRLASI
jgi:hypothetical protein